MNLYLSRIFPKESILSLLCALSVKKKKTFWQRFKNCDTRKRIKNRYAYIGLYKRIGWPCTPDSIKYRGSTARRIWAITLMKQPEQASGGKGRGEGAFSNDLVSTGLLSRPRPVTSHPSFGGRFKGLWLIINLWINRGRIKKCQAQTAINAMQRFRQLPWNYIKPDCPSSSLRFARVDLICV